ncbi:MAG: tryptophan synthase subunit alpha [Acidobacteriota bacterium]
MSRIASKFEKLRAEGRKGFIPFITAGDPSIDASLKLALKLAELGADVIELGVPFSDPMADGPTIQRSSERAVAAGTRLVDVLECAAKIRERSDIAIVLFSYLNPLLSFGIENAAAAARDSGIDGILITDAIGREAREFSEIFGRNGIDLISLIAPTTTDERLLEICRSANGFLYAVSRTGITGGEGDWRTSAETLVKRARRMTDLPIAVGFGIKDRDDVLSVWKYADAAVVGSAIVAAIENSASGDETAAVESIVRSMLPEVANHDSKS